MTYSRKTRAQRAVLTALKDVGSATPMELFDKINSIGSARHIGLTSVYRALNTLVENGELKRERLNETTARYGFNDDTTTHSHHLVCVKCNERQPLAECPFDSKELLVEQRFTPLYHNFQIFGLCFSCEPAREPIQA
ncbi:MAG: transcriptional repressor [Candidatus Obscuribacterales bacterium]|nr:transcriptional repressor [Candidatus Obscuribacterales bacterium]